VRQYERQRRQDVVLFLDLWEPSRPTEHQLDAVELAVSFAATIVADLCRRGGSQVHLHVGGRVAKSLGGTASQGLLGEMLSALALAQAAEADSLPNLMSDGLNTAPRSARLLVVSTRPVNLHSAAIRKPLSDSAARLLVEMRPLTVNCGSRELEEYFALV
jgi:uncharacterized protein (DUF58 family)